MEPTTFQAQVWELIYDYAPASVREAIERANVGNGTELVTLELTREDRLAMQSIGYEIEIALGIPG